MWRRVQIQPQGSHHSPATGEQQDQERLAVREGTSESYLHLDGALLYVSVLLDLVMPTRRSLAVPRSPRDKPSQSDHRERRMSPVGRLPAITCCDCCR